MLKSKENRLTSMYYQICFYKGLSTIDPTFKHKFCKKARRFFIKSQEKGIPCERIVKEALKLASSGDCRKYQKAVEAAFSTPMTKEPNILQKIFCKIIGWFTKLVGLTKIKNRVPVPFKL